MLPNEYQKLAARTECDQEQSRRRMAGVVLQPGHKDLHTPVRLNHAVLGLSGEVGELAAAVEKWLYYGQELDRHNVSEEIGDCLWYLALACNALGVDMGTVMGENVRKLRARYPEKYEDGLALYRDLGEERKAVEGAPEREGDEARCQNLIQNGHGWAEPPEDEN